MSETEITCADVPNCSDDELEKRRCDITQIKIEPADYGVAIGVLFIKDTGARMVVYLTHGQAVSLSADLWNRTRKPGETR